MFDRREKNMKNIEELFKFIKWSKIYDKTESRKAGEDSMIYFGLSDKDANVSILNWNYDWKKNENKELLKEKMNLLSEFNPDILVLQECSYHECIFFTKYFKYVKWYGDGKDGHNGICVLSNKFAPRIICYDIYEQKFRYVVPYEININGITILLLAVWTKDYLRTENIFPWENVKDDVHCLSYTQNIVEAINFYDDSLKKYSDVILVGDFNSFDKKLKREKRQKDIEDKLKLYDIFNCSCFPGYNFLDGQSFETEVTYYPDKNDPEKAGTDDYCFLKKSENITLFRFGIGNPKEWLKYSDHLPLWIELGVKKPN